MYDYLIAFLNCGPIFQTVSHNFYPRTQNGSQNLREVELSSVSVNADEDEEEGDEEDLSSNSNSNQGSLCGESLHADKTKLNECNDRVKS